MMKLSIPKFHDKTSLWLGVIGGLLLTASGIYCIAVLPFISIGIFQVMIGSVLAIHCLDMIKIYRRHRILKIVKTDTHRVIYKDIIKSNKLICGKNALKTAWLHKPFRVWIVLCTIGIVIGLLVGIGMTNLVLLVAIACLGWAMETANTSIEILLDLVHPEYSERVKLVKDLFAVVPMFVYSAYVISWLILVAPKLIERIAS